ncbi:hypothetical protein AVEN_86000-1 [Araneus ventricosus]|uniref:Uncharacterized protein n=1 Tax=Araneus ventricosus TaxID=182803 RepID=A0A4Y2RW57_ARAVE|nr:hypothetical protein AVEN_103238-1 [Araneus ventricosus]GBN35192.1 hypothetical protein AVEN_14625-1 [Araneus ventricosus]GBN79461.1 hypothetical protein AVEN_174607-1 [Araneus ventricosus]GBN79469.1 hypothetical protein AVEN_86000-1 [Araneus ventricosus]
MAYSFSEKGTFRRPGGSGDNGTCSLRTGRMVILACATSCRSESDILSFFCVFNSATKPVARHKLCQKIAVSHSVCQHAIDAYFPLYFLKHSDKLLGSRRARRVLRGYKELFRTGEEKR